MIAALRAALVAGAAMMADIAAAEPTYTILDFKDLDGWERDDHFAALRVFQNTCPDLDAPDWRALCAAAPSFGDAKKFFELLFKPVLIEDGVDMKFTGYFEPELQGSRVPTARYRFPVYAKPPEVRLGQRWLSRREIEDSKALEGRGLEIAWVDDSVELFFLQIQGSGRIKLSDGSAIRVGYGGANGHPYRSIGTELVRRGTYQPHQVSAQVIQNWVNRNPVDGAELLRHNPSYVFFRRVDQVPADKGPLGAMNRSITTMRSVAVDPAYTPLGAPVWVEKDGADPIRRLMIAQDTGSAIKGAQRADIFFGTGDEAGRKAGRLRDPGRMIVLLPIQRAYSLLPEAVL
ncbi:MAG: MltA domain-containing protein [Pseudomonadota bacterium]|nr:MltA domain-containing protein [Pseudomonadota bacterium]